MDGQDDMDMAGQVQEYPIWRQAATDSMKEFGYGDTIPHEWLWAHLEIDPPDDWRGSMDDFKSHQFDLLTKMDGFRSVLLEEHKRFLVNERGIGYKIVLPKMQTSEAMHRLHNELRRNLLKTMRALVHVNETVLSLEEAKENAEAKAKVSWLNTMGVKRLEKPTTESPDQAGP